MRGKNWIEKRLQFGDDGVMSQCSQEHSQSWLRLASLGLQLQFSLLCIFPPLRSIFYSSCSMSCPLFPFLSFYLISRKRLFFRSRFIALISLGNPALHAAITFLHPQSFIIFKHTQFQLWSIWRVSTVRRKVSTPPSCTLSLRPAKSDIYQRCMPSNPHRPQTIPSLGTLGVRIFPPSGAPGKMVIERNPSRRIHLRQTGCVRGER